MSTYVAVGDDGRIVCGGTGCSGTQNSTTGKHLNGVGRAHRNRSSGVMLVLAVGDDGMIVRKKTNSEWEQLASGTGRDLNDVSFARGTKTAWAVGDEGTILKTHDGGSSWGFQSAHTSRHLRAVFAIDENAVWIAGDEGELYHSDDGGKTWIRIPIATSKHLRGICVSGDVFIGVGDDGTVIDARASGTKATVHHAESKHLRAVWCAPGGVSIAVGDDGWIGRRPRFYEEQRAWTVLSGVTSKDLNGVIAWSDDHWVIVGDDGEILTSTDGGGTWSKSQRGSKHLLAVG